MDALDEKKAKSEKLRLKKRRWKLKLILFTIFIVIGFEIMTALIKPTLIALCKVKSQSLANSASFACNM